MAFENLPRQQSRFLRLDDGEEAEIVIVGDERSANVVGWGRDARLAREGEEEKVKWRFAVNVYNVTSRSMQVFEGGLRLARDISAKKGGKTGVLRLSREGSGPKTRYSVKLLRDLDADEIAHLKTCQRHDLSMLWSGASLSAPSPARAGSAVSDVDLPF